MRLPKVLDSPIRSTRSGKRMRLVAWALYDWGISAYATVVQTFVFAAYFTQRVARDDTVGNLLWGCTLGGAGLVVALGAPVLGAAVDQGGRRKRWVAAFTALGVAATALLWFIQPDAAFVIPAVVLVAVGTISTEFAAVFYNAMLPRLAPLEQLGRWSGWGWGLGYAGGLLCLVVALLAFVRDGAAWLDLDQSAAEPVRATCLLAAAWFALFALPLFLYTPNERGTSKGLGRSLRDGVTQLGETVRQARRHAPLFRFLIARMVYINGLTTLFAFGGIYAAGTFGMTEHEVLLFGIALNVTAGIGAVGFAWIDDRIGGRRTILLALVGLMVAGLLIVLIESQTLFWAFGLFLGLFVGPAQAAGRSFLARVSPAPLQNEVFGLQALSGKATAFLGPLVVGGVTYTTGSQRLGMSTILIFFAVGLALMWTVPDEEALQ